MHPKVRGKIVLGASLALVAGIAQILPLSGDIVSVHAASQTASVSPYSDAEVRSFETSEERKIRELRDQEITQLRIALGRRLPGNRRADLYFRLAELYLEAYRAEYLLEGKVHEQRYTRGDKNPNTDHSHSRPYLKSGIQASSEILKLGIAYPQLDQVYYFLGFNYGEMGDERQSLEYYEAITRKFPNSQFAVEAYRELGDHAYGQASYRKALTYYEAASRRAPAETQPRILHKLAWCYYRVKQFDAAIATMKQAVNVAQRNGEKFLNLKEEALRDMALFMTENDRVEEAIAYFQQTVGDKNFYPRILERLGKQYERNVEPVKATQVYESLLKTNPESEAAFRVLVKLVDLDLRRGRYREALARLQNPKMPQAPKGGEEETQVAAQNLRAMIRRTATEHHEKFRTKGERASLEIAESYYALYLNSFLAKSDPRGESSEIQMYLAEVKRELGKSKEASELYRRVVDSRDKRYAKEAGALWTASLSEAIKKSEGAGGTEPSKLELEYVDAADRLQDALGDTAEGREAALRAAQVLAGYKSTQPDAVKRIRKLISKSPKSAQGLTAARLWLQISSENDKREDDLRDVVQKVRADEALMATDQEIGKGKLHAQLAELDTRLRISTISKNEKDKDFNSAAKGYESFAQDAKEKDVAEKAYTNAVATYLKAGDIEAADRVSSAWLKRYPKSPKAVESLRSSATQLLIQGRFDLAGKIFEQLGTDGGDADSLETAARIFEGTGDTQRAQSDWSYHTKTYKASAHRGSILLSLAKSYEAAQMDREAVQTYRECMSVSADLEAECGVRLSDLYERIKNSEESKALLKKVAAQGQAPAGSKKKVEVSVSPWVGYARFKLADQLESSQVLEPVALPEAQLKKSVTQRLEFLESLSRAYNSVVDAGGPWAVAALDRLALWAMKFADEVDAIAPPEKYNEKQAENFRKSMQTVSAPLRKKAIDTWSDAYRKASAAEVYSSALPAIADHLAVYQDGKVPSRAQGFRAKFRLAGMPSDGGSDGSAKAMEKIRDKLTKTPQDASAWVDYGNLLWGSGKPLLARIAYERAMGLNSKNGAAINNRAVTLVNAAGGEEDWIAAAEASASFQRVLKDDEFFFPAKMNRALLLNYYRLFEKAKPLWEQILVRNAVAEAQDGLAISLQGLGDKSSEAAFKKATALGLSSDRFSLVYHEAARDARARAEACLSRLDDIRESSVSGFEKEAIESLKRDCTLWKTRK